MANSRQWYSHSNYVVSGATLTDVTDWVRQCVWFIKANLLQQIGSFVNQGPEGAAPSSALWVCEGSSSSVASSMDGVDRWTNTFDPTKMVYQTAAAGGNTGSWICLRSPAALGPVWLTIQFDSGYGQAVGLYLSYAKPTFVSIASYPTKTLVTGTTNEGIADGTVPTGVRFHFSIDANGNFWSFMSGNNQGYAQSCIAVQELVNLRYSADPYPTVMVTNEAGSPNGVLRDDQTSYGFFRNSVNGIVKGLMYNGTAFRGACLAFDGDSNNTFTNIMGSAGFSQDGLLDSFPCTLFNGNAAPFGIKGDFPDVRNVSRSIPSGSRSPPSGNIDQIVFGSCLIPMTVVPTL